MTLYLCGMALSFYLRAINAIIAVMKTTTIKQLILSTMVSVLLISCGQKPAAEEPAPTPEVVTPEPTVEPTPEPKEEYELSEEDLASFRQELEEDQAINGDVKALLHFNSGLIHKPVVQGETEDYYLYRNWETHEYLSYGSITLDSRNDLSAPEQNTIIYGHYVYPSKNPDRTLAFSSLDFLKDPNIYEENRYVELILKDEIRYYEIASVYEAPLETIDGVQYCMYGIEYNLLEYDEEYMDLYKSNIKRYEYFNTGVEISTEDKLLTLQTCIENQHDSREIVLLRELKRVSLEETDHG